MFMIEIISATRLKQDEFFRTSPLGQSLHRLKFDSRIKADIAFENSDGLPLVYNRAIAARPQEAILVFVHDDVWIEDYFLTNRLHEGLHHFDVIGVAGNRRRVKGQSSWYFTGPERQRDAWENLSGLVAHGKMPFGQISAFGPTPAACELLDGLFLAARRSVLVQNTVGFDPRFRFHFYDMDFCRTARGANLKLGTWPICLTHQSGGNFASASWAEGYQTYLAKWSE